MTAKAPRIGSSLISAAPIRQRSNDCASAGASNAQRAH
jgi:hypothetical protein